MAAKVSQTDEDSSVVEDTPLLLTKTPTPVEKVTIGSYIRNALKTADRTVVILTCLVILLGTINRVLYKIMTVPMAHYSYFLSNFNSICYTICYFVILFVRFRMGRVTWAMLKYPKYKLVLIGCMDSLGSVLGLIGAAHLSGPLSVLLPNGTILFTILVSILMLRQRYTLFQCLAAALILSGVFVTIIPKILGQDFEGGGFGFILIYFFSTAPNAVSFCTKELVFREQKDLDIFVVNSFGSMFQLFFTFAFLPLVSIPGFGGVPFNQLHTYFANAAQCWAGINPTPQDDCYGSPLLPFMYIAVNLSWNICLLLLLKKGGAFYMFIAITASLPIAENLFNINWPLLKATPFSWYHIGGLLIILVGIVLYRLVTMRKDAQTQLEKQQRLLERGVNASDGEDEIPPPVCTCGCCDGIRSRVTCLRYCC